MNFRVAFIKKRRRANRAFACYTDTPNVKGCMKIYTRKGDSGQTSLYDGDTVAKNSERVRAYGSIDELNSTLGLAIASCSAKHSSAKHSSSKHAIVDWGTQVQADLFVLGSWLSSPKACQNIAETKDPWTSKASLDPLPVNKESISAMESQIDSWEKNLQPLQNFILPGGSVTGAQFHLARTVCRRAERECVHLKEIGEQMPALVSQYLNRLSDALFVCARVVNSIEKIEETPWKGK